ncbi:MAG: T9SS type A sorting domain-containing protein [Rhodothermaceae bacterium]|nr:T9SS type A sorting domain-containing protein [Rhodothermaceae bacterium]
MDTDTPFGNRFQHARRVCYALVLPLLLALSDPVVHAQLAFGLGGTGSDQGSAIAVDAAGNMYLSGLFFGTADFDPGPGVFELTAGGTATFVASYDILGALRYAFAIGGASVVVPERGIAVDDAGNVYVTGSFTGLVDFDPGPDENLLNFGDGRIFVASYDPNGTLLYAFNVGGGLSNLIEGGAAIALDAAEDNLYITGTFNDEDDFDPDGDGPIIESDGNTDAFVASYGATSGAFRFAFRLGGSGTDQGFGIATDAANNCYVTGWFRETADFDPGIEEHLLTSEGGEDLFLASYTGDGDFRYALGVGSLGSASADRGRAVAVDAAGNAFMTGHFGGDIGEMADFDPGLGEEILTSNGNEDAFLASYDPNGDLRFAFGFGGPDPTRGYGTTLDADGNVYLTGLFAGAIDFDPGPGEQIVGTIGDHAFGASYTHTGAYRLAYHFPSIGVDGGETGYGIAVDAAAQPHITGAFGQTVDFDPGSGVAELTASGPSDIFVTNFAATTVAAEPLAPLAESFTLSTAYPNPSTGLARLNLVVRKTQPVHAEVVDVLGRRVALLYDSVLPAGTQHTLTVEGEDLPSGLYFVRVQGATFATQQPVLVTK